MLYDNPFLIILATDWKYIQKLGESDGIKHNKGSCYLCLCLDFNERSSRKPIDNHDAEDYHSQHHRSQKSALEWLKILAAPAAPCKIG